jgi:hypothetical protein
VATWPPATDRLHVVSFDGTCQECGEELEPDQPEFHRLCWSCWRAENGDGGDSWHEEKPPAGVPNESVIVAIHDLRRELEELRRRVEWLEGAA